MCSIHKGSQISKTNDLAMNTRLKTFIWPTINLILKYLITANQKKVQGSQVFGQIFVFLVKQGRVG